MNEGPVDPQSAIPNRIGRYRILDILGLGGMGVVYLAEQTEPIRRRVALKLIKLGMDTKQTLGRFESERQALALMNHPSVAKVLDAGATEQGRPYFVMEHVQGIPITEHCDRHRLSTKERLELFSQVCHAVQHAHQKGIIHRDIKPSNILVAVQDGKRIPKVIDFGVAKATQQRLTERTLFTEQGQLIGTPEYMSPEQAEMTAEDIDTRTDIYSLGVVLYELLAGALPFDPVSLRQASFAEIQRIIREEEPLKPSTRLRSLDTSVVAKTPEPRASARANVPIPEGAAPVKGVRGTHDYERFAQAEACGSGAGRGTDRRSSTAQQIARKRRTDPGTLVKLLRGDLDWITMKALEKDRARRYITATELADDIARHIKHEPVKASPPGAGYRFKKFARRNKGILASTAAVFVVLLGGVIVSTLQYNNAERARQEAESARISSEQDRDAAEQARDDAEAVGGFLVTMLASVDPGRKGKDVTVRTILDEASKTVKETFADKPLIEARLQNVMGRSYHSLGLYDAAEQHQTAAVTIFQRELGRNHQKTVDAIDNLASTLLSQGEFAPGGDMHRKNYEIQRRILGEEHFKTLNSMNSLAVSLEDKGQYSEAAGLFRKLLEIRRRVRGAEDPQTLLSMNNLANTFFRQSKFAEAEKLYRNVLEIQRRVLGKEHPFTLATMNNLAGAIKEQAQYAEAEMLYRKTIEIKGRILGEEHSSTLSSMSNLAEVLGQLGRLAEADQLYRKTLNAVRGSLGNMHPSLGYPLVGLAELLLLKGEAVEAKDLILEALGVHQAALPEDHWVIAYTQSVLGECLAAQGDHDGAESLVVASYARIKSAKGESCIESTKALERIVNLYESWDAAEPAKGHAQKAAEWRAKLPGAGGQTDEK